MATLPIDDGFISVREYLRTSYSPDCEYVDGRIEERNLGEKEHSILQTFLAFLFRLHRVEWGVEVFAELRTHVAARRFRIPDVLVTRAGVKFESVLDSPPLIAIEILSPDDRLSGMQQVTILARSRQSAAIGAAVGFEPSVAGGFESRSDERADAFGQFAQPSRPRAAVGFRGGFLGDEFGFLFDPLRERRAFQQFVVEHRFGIPHRSPPIPLRGAQILGGVGVEVGGRQS